MEVAYDGETYYSATDVPGSSSYPTNKYQMTAQYYSDDAFHDTCGNVILSRVLIAITLSVVSTVTACASASRAGTGAAVSTAVSASLATSTSAAPPTTGLPAVYAGPLTSIQKIDNGAIVMSPPSDPGAAVLTWQTAYSSVCSDGTGVCGTTSEASVSLALVTTLKSGQPGADGAILPLIDNALSYVLRWKDEPCAPAGGTPGAPSSEATKTYTCGIVDFVDAITGKNLYALEGPSV